MKKSNEKSIKDGIMFETSRKTRRNVQIWMWLLKLYKKNYKGLAWPYCTEYTDSIEYGELEICNVIDCEESKIFAICSRLIFFCKWELHYSYCECILYCWIYLSRKNKWLLIAIEK